MNNKYSLPKDGGLIAESTPRDIIHRYEKIHTTVYENEYLGVQYVADTIVKAIRTYNELHCSNEVYEEQQPFVLGLTTGRTPLGLYRELVKRHKEGLVSFRNVAYSVSTSSTPSARPSSRAATSASTRISSTTSTSCPKTSTFPTAPSPRTRFRSTAPRTTIRCARST